MDILDRYPPLTKFYDCHIGECLFALSCSLYTSSQAHRAAAASAGSKTDDRDGADDAAGAGLRQELASLVAARGGRGSGNGLARCTAKTPEDVVVLGAFNRCELVDGP